MNLVDDASSTSHSLFAPQETIFAAMELLWQGIDRYGIPRARYTDRKNVYVGDEKTREKAADSGLEALTQFGRACKQLDLRIIEAYSPQAKGRVERHHGTYQDRLVKELRLQQIAARAPANELLAISFCQQLNQKFAVAPRSTADYHRSAKGYELAAIFGIQEERTAAADWIVRFENQFYQLTPRRKSQAPRDKIMVQRYLNGELHFRYGPEELSYTLLPERPQPKTKPKQKKRTTSKHLREQSLVPANQAWQGFQFGKASPWTQS